MNRTPRRRTGRALPAAVGALALITLTACGGSGFEEGSGGASSEGGEAGGLQVLIGSSGEAETDAVTEAATAWGEGAGTEVTVTAASDLPQQLSQGFASSTPPDVFYVPSDLFAAWAEAGSLLPYGGQLESAQDFYPNLTASFTTEDGTVYCAPKDFSTLALIIDDAAWAEAGLTEADVPTTWEQLADVAQRLTREGRPGLVTSSEFQRLGAFMAQAGGGLVSEDGRATADTPENLAALEYVRSLLASGAMAFAADVGAGWGGEAIGTGAAAMTIEGNWIVGGVSADYPDLEYTVAELPAGPAGKGTLAFTTCWGVATDSPDQEVAVELVRALTSTDQQLAFTEAFGVMPSVGSAAEGFSTQFPEQAAFLAGAEYATPVPNQAGVADVITDLNAQLETLATGDPQAILSSTQANLDAVLGS